MSYRTGKQDMTTAVFENAVGALGNGRTFRSQGYRVPFSERRALLITMDSLLILISLWCAFILWGRADTGAVELWNYHMVERWYWAPLLFGGWWVLSWLNDLYDVPSAHDKALSVVRVGTVSMVGLCIYLCAFFLSPDTLPRIFFLNFLILASFVTIVWRFGYAELSQVIPFYHRVLVIGLGERASTITQALDLAPGLKYKVVGYVDDGTPATAKSEEMSIVGRTDELSHLVQHLHVNEVVVAIERHLDRDLFQLLVECQANGIRVSWMPDLYEKVCRKIPIHHIDPAWALQAMQDQPLFSRLQLGIKRLFDLVLVLSVMPTIMLITPLIALAIKLDSSGPVFYRQKRCGRAGEPFYIYKFRTMTTDAEKDGKARWATVNDMRITNVGRVLRKMRLDELPQVFNILRGEMSIVGPRPERPEFVEDLQKEIPYYRTRLMVKPGLTGWAQVHYDYGNTVEDAAIKLQYDFYYVRYWSIWLDLYTIFRTFSVVLQFKGM